jgi:tetratricopeptide (TPR) repeat protein
MRNYIIAFGVLITGSLAACTSQNAITENKQSPKPNLSLNDVVPVRNVASPEEKQSQKKFVTQQTKRFKNRKAGSAYYAHVAKRQFNDAKLDSASISFGRAWLLDSTNNDVYWGYGLVYGQQKDYDKALYSLYHALDSDQHNARLLTDLATTHLNRFYATSSPDDLLQSRKLLELAVRYAPNKAEASYKLAVSYYYLQEYAKAWESLHRSISKDKTVADNTFIAALLEKQPDPAGKYQR